MTQIRRGICAVSDVSSKEETFVEKERAKRERKQTPQHNGGDINRYRERKRPILESQAAWRERSNSYKRGREKKDKIKRGGRDERERER